MVDDKRMDNEHPLMEMGAEDSNMHFLEHQHHRIQCTVRLCDIYVVGNCVKYYIGRLIYLYCLKH